ncbi:MAG: signal peptidase I [Gemmatales bacterium]|nr:signal peptidase I [Gemmatales bacterium]MDW8388358.1 signal peptidase I [Gemmatales bacterium]
MTTLALVVAVFLGCLLILSTGLWIGLRVTRARRSRFAWAFGAMAISTAGWLVLYRGMTNIPLPEGVWYAPHIALMVTGVLGILWACLVSLLLLRANLVQILGGWFSALPAFVLVWLLLQFVVQPYVMEIAYLRSNSMAPTLLALHHVGICPHCGGTAFVPYTTNFEHEPPGARFGMCGDCRKCCQVSEMDATIWRADRFVINKIVEPRRWDLVTYRDPRRQVTFTKRVVGLPGEEVYIREGKVFINGEAMPLPAALEGLEFTLHQFDGRPALWGTPDNPAALGEDEYFVLDDFSIRGHDSRMWTTPLPGHPPYALPRSCIEGVVGLIIWPEDRMRLLR